MEAKQKAVELFIKFLKTPNTFGVNRMTVEEAKQCALIAVENIINANPHSNPLNTIVHSTMQYWLDVKQEIQNL
jgi:hypothetical protein